VIAKCKNNKYESSIRWYRSLYSKVAWKILSYQKPDEIQKSFKACHMLPSYRPDKHSSSKAIVSRNGHESCVHSSIPQPHPLSHTHPDRCYIFYQQEYVIRMVWFSQDNDVSRFLLVQYSHNQFYHQAQEVARMTCYQHRASIRGSYHGNLLFFPLQNHSGASSSAVNSRNMTTLAAWFSSLTCSLAISHPKQFYSTIQHQRERLHYLSSTLSVTRICKRQL